MAEHVTPAACPVCTGKLSVTRLSCESCGTEISGSFPSCPYCSLRGDERALLDFFLVSRGNMKAVERKLGVSYPTARARVDALVEKLFPAADRSWELETLNALARGELSVEEAERRLDAGPVTPSTGA
ncbi:MAG: DUF2089 domain-containing protein [Actinomycetes bacterium]